jgi:hypothetical protein
VQSLIEDENTGQQTYVILWAGSDYDNVGNWTDADADDRLEELATAENVKQWFNVDA